MFSAIIVELININIGDFDLRQEKKNCRCMPNWLRVKNHFIGVMTSANFAKLNEYINQQ